MPSTIQTEVDIQVLVDQIQEAALRRQLFVDWHVGHQKWTITSPNWGGAIVGWAEKLEDLFAVLDQYPIVEDAAK